MPWGYATEEGPNGQWRGTFVHWSWRKYLANLDAQLYEDMFANQGIRQFVFRALPFPYPYPALAGYPTSNSQSFARMGGSHLGASWPPRFGTYASFPTSLPPAKGGHCSIGAPGGPWKVSSSMWNIC